MIFRRVQDGFIDLSKVYKIQRVGERGIRFWFQGVPSPEVDEFESSEEADKQIKAITAALTTWEY